MLQGHGSIIPKCLQGCHDPIARNRGVKTFDIGLPFSSSEGYSLPLVNSFPFGAHSSLYLPAEAGIHFSSTATVSSTQKEYFSMARAELPLRRYCPLPGHHQSTIGPYRSKWFSAFCINLVMSEQQIRTIRTKHGFPSFQISITHCKTEVQRPIHL